MSDEDIRAIFREIRSKEKMGILRDNDFLETLSMEEVRDLWELTK